MRICVAAPTLSGGLSAVLSLFRLLLAFRTLSPFAGCFSSRPLFKCHPSSALVAPLISWPFIYSRLGSFVAGQKEEKTHPSSSSCLSSSSRSGVKRTDGPARPPAHPRPSDAWLVSTPSFFPPSQLFVLLLSFLCFVPTCVFSSFA